MTGAIGLLAGGDADGIDHVRLLIEYRLDQAFDAGRVVGVVAIHHHINIGLDIGEHSSDDVAFAVLRLGPANGACRSRDS
jgi:hypothetical protein